VNFLGQMQRHDITSKMMRESEIEEDIHIRNLLRMSREKRQEVEWISC
jgi:hypothetical protein